VQATFDYSSLPLLLLELALYCCPCNPCCEQGSSRADKTGRKTFVIVQDAPEPFRELPATRASAAPLSERQHQKYEQREAEKEQEELSEKLPNEPFHRPNPLLPCASRPIPWFEDHKTFGGSGHIKSHRSCRLGSSRLGQSPFSCSFHFIMFALRPYFSMSLETL
jgi:hypothetical protein